MIASACLRRPTLSRAAAVVALAVAAAARTLAQPVDPADGGPVIFGTRPQYEKIHFDRPIIGISLDNVYRQESLRSGGVSSEAREYFFTQTVDMATRGFVLHPNFFDIQLSGSAGVSETFFESDFDSGNAFGTLYNWDARGTFFRNANPVTIYSKREQSWQFPQFGPALETTTTDTGASLDIRNTRVPTHLAVSHVDSTQSGLRGSDDFTYTRDAFTWFSSTEPGPGQSLRWSYNFATTEQSGTTSNTYDTHDAQLSHEWRFGSERQHNLRSTLDYSLRSGQTDYQSLRWTEHLFLRHTDRFSTRYRTNVDRYEIAGLQRTRERGAAGFTHRLYDSLVTNGNLGAQHTGGDGSGDTINTFADIGLDYDKRVPFGALAANLGYSWDRQDSDADTATIPILDQPASFSDPLPIVLTGTNIDPNSILISDPSGLILYQPGVDYTLTTFPDRVEISRIIGGRIAPGQSVLLDYNRTPLPGVTSTTNVLTAGLRYDIDQGALRGLGLYTRYTNAEQSIDSAQPSAFIPNNYTDTLYGIDYRFWNFFVGAEHQTHDAEINPFDADRVFARYTHRLSVDTAVQVGTTYAQIRYEEPENTVDLFTASAILQKDFSRRLSGTATILYRDQTDDLRGQTTGWEQQLELRWRHRQTDVYMLFRNAQLDTIDQEESFQFFQLGIRREF